MNDLLTLLFIPRETTLVLIGRETDWHPQQFQALRRNEPSFHGIIIE
jgi:hypothetical protein